MASRALSADDRAAADALAADLRRVFGDRLFSFVAYGLERRRDDDAPLHTLALVERLRFEDLAACVPLASAWRRRGLAVPLVLTREEFQRSLDVFPLEYGDIISHHALIAGRRPFEGFVVAEPDLRRACEQQAKSHLIHLREGFLESAGKPDAIARLIAASADPFVVLLGNVSRLEGIADDDLASAGAKIGVPADVVRDVVAAAASQSTIAEPTALLSRYIAATEQLWKAVDTWRVRN